MAEEAAQAKREGKATATLRGPTAQQVWPLLEDFCSIHNWLPGVDTCYRVEGDPGQPGLIRCCASSTTSSTEGGDAITTTKWCHEKLLAMDPIERSLVYEVLDNNLGIKFYVAKMRIFPVADEQQPGCQIEWSFLTDLSHGLNFESLLAYVESSLQSMAEQIEKGLQFKE